MAARVVRRRNSLRFQGHDYAQPGWYYVTIVTQDRLALFGEVDGNAVRLNAGGKIVDDFLRRLPTKFASVTVDASVIMPNHIHALFHLDEVRGGHAGPPLQQIMRWFKAMTTNAYIKFVVTGDAEEFERRLWQRSYHDRVLRDGEDCERIREYIRHNPSNWASDEDNPANVPL